MARALPIPAENRATDPMRAALWAIGSAAAFACAAGLIRRTSEDVHPFEIAFFRNVVSLCAMSPWFLSKGFGVLKTERIGLYSLRAVLALGAMLSWFTALSLLPLAEAIALSFTTPIFTTILAALVLREAVRARRWWAVIAGFAGVLVIIRPGVGAFDPAMLLVLLTATFFACSGITVKTLSRTESPNAIVTWMVIFLVPMSAIPAAFVWETPAWEMVPWLIAVGLTTTMGHMGMTRAYNLADASAVTPFFYVQLPFAALIGYLAFAQRPDLWTWVGAAVIAGSSLYIARREAQAARQAKAGA